MNDDDMTFGHMVRLPEPAPVAEFLTGTLGMGTRDVDIMAQRCPALAIAMHHGRRVQAWRMVTNGGARSHVGIGGMGFRTVAALEWEGTTTFRPMWRAYLCIDEHNAWHYCQAG